MENIKKIFNLKKGFVNIIAYFLQTSLFWFILLIVFLVIGGFLFKIFYTKKKYGTRHIIKHQKQASTADFLTFYIENLKGYKKIVKCSSSIQLMISEYGNYLFSLYKETDYIEGHYQDAMWIRKKDRIPLPNPFIDLLDIQRHIEKKFQIPVRKILVISDKCHLNVTDYKNEMIFKESKFVFAMESKMGLEKKYSKEQVDHLYKNYCQQMSNKGE